MDILTHTATSDSYKNMFQSLKKVNINKLNSKVKQKSQEAKDKNFHEKKYGLQLLKKLGKGAREKINLSLKYYRPIPLLPSIGKILENLLNKRLLEFINKSKATKIDRNIFEFQKQSITYSALSQVFTSLNKCLDDGQYVMMQLVDLRKAFDLVDHNTLLYSGRVRS